MKIGIISDTHLGYAWGTERQEDAFNQAAEAFEKAVEMTDLILIPGDIFDSRVPKQEIMEKTLNLFAKISESKNNGVKISNVSPLTTRGTPVIAIHGNHERRGANLTNPVKALESAGLLIYLHCNHVTAEKNGEKINFFGLSAVPEHYSPDVLKEWGPSPQEGKNIFVFHQNMKEVLLDEISYLSTNELPEGFDLYVNGHIHKKQLIEEQGKKLLLPGSTVVTQIKKSEVEEPKGFYIYDSQQNSLEFIPLDKTREYFVLGKSFDEAEPNTVIQECRKEIEKVFSKEFGSIPFIRLKLSGTIKTGAFLDKKKISEGFNAIISFTDDLSSLAFKKKISEVRELQKQKQSIEDLGVKLLETQLKQSDYDFISSEELLELLESNDMETVLNTILEKAKA